MASLLLVDDDEDLCENLKDLFEIKEHSVVVASTGRAASIHLNEGRFDLILLDWELPDAQGIDICKAYRDKGGKSPVLMMTGKRDDASRASMLDAGATETLTKPFNIQQLLEQVEKLLARI